MTHSGADSLPLPLSPRTHRCKNREEEEAAAGGVLTLTERVCKVRPGLRPSPLLLIPTLLLPPPALAFLLRFPRLPRPITTNNHPRPPPSPAPARPVSRYPRPSVHPRTSPAHPRLRQHSAGRSPRPRNPPIRMRPLLLLLPNLPRPWRRCRTQLS